MKLLADVLGLVTLTSVKMGPSIVPNTPVENGPEAGDNDGVSESHEMHDREW